MDNSSTREGTALMLVAILRGLKHIKFSMTAHELSCITRPCSRIIHSSAFHAFHDVRYTIKSMVIVNTPLVSALVCI